MKNRILWGLANIALIGLIVWAVIALMNRPTPEGPANPILTHYDIRGLQPISPPLEAPDEDLFLDAKDETVNLSRYKDKVVILNFWATWCAPCVKELPALNKLKELRPNIEVLAVSFDTAKGVPELRAFLDKYEAKGLAVFHSPDMKLQKLLPSRGIPTTFLITRSGKIFNKVEGDIDWSSDKTLALIDETAELQ